jgi:hypothetical protein
LSHGALLGYYLPELARAFYCGPMVLSKRQGFGTSIEGTTAPSYSSLTPASDPAREQLDAKKIKSISRPIASTVWELKRRLGGRRVANTAQAAKFS